MGASIPSPLARRERARAQPNCVVCAAGLCGPRRRLEHTSNVCTRKCTAMKLVVSMRAAVQRQVVSMLPHPRKSSHIASMVLHSPCSAGRAGHGEAFARAAMGGSLAHLARRVPTPRHPQRPQPAAVRRAVGLRFPGVWCGGKGRGRAKSTPRVFSEVAVQTGPQTVQNALRGAKFARAGRPLAGFVALSAQISAGRLKRGLETLTVHWKLNANKNLSNSAPVMEPGTVCRDSPYKTLDFDLVGT